MDDDQILRDRLAQAFRERGFDVRVASSFDEALFAAQAQSPQMAIVDLKMPGGNGLDLVRLLKQRDPNVRIVVLTGYGSIATAVQAIRDGATYYLPKPADAEEILAALSGSGNPPEAAYEPAPSLARTEWEHIHRVLTDCGGNITQTAKRLGIHRRSLQRKLLKNRPR